MKYSNATHQSVFAMLLVQHLMPQTALINGKSGVGYKLILMSVSNWEAR